MWQPQIQPSRTLTMILDTQREPCNMRISQVYLLQDEHAPEEDLMSATTPEEGILANFLHKSPLFQKDLCQVTGRVCQTKRRPLCQELTGCGSRTSSCLS